ncbi:TPA: site-specific integrase [Yersinia enterocolitica]|uniref:site-specific integrase n=2 Tax=Yersinia enterocolitica TaxID=630 RepID=UPI0036F44644
MSKLQDVNDLSFSKTCFFHFDLCKCKGRKSNYSCLILGGVNIRKMRVDGNKAWKAGLKRAGIDNFRFHDLRHTWASWLVQSGVPLFALQEMGGWESIEMVRKYAHLSPIHLTQHAKQIDGILNLNGTNMAREYNQDIFNVV